MERGQIVEEGTHRELLARYGKYAYFYSLQVGTFPSTEVKTSNVLPCLGEHSRERSYANAKSRPISADLADVLVLKHRLRKTLLGDDDHRAAYALGRCHVLGEEQLP